MIPPLLLYGATIVSSAFLLFLVQPIIAKQILPWFGGSAAVWTVCLMFFQAVLLAGYAYAHGLTRLRPRLQFTVHLVLLVLSLASLPIVAASGWKPGGDADPTWRIAGLLVATIGLPYFLLSSTGPLIQKWFSSDAALAARRASVYRLFALSNLGSLVGLLVYPFVVEPYASLRVQSWAWSGAYAAFVVVCAACAWRVQTSAIPLPVAAKGHDAAAVAPSPGRYAFWLVCAALGSMLLLALTTHMSQNIAPIPFLWVLPLTLYLLSFVVVFEGRGGQGWYMRRWWLPVAAAALIAMAWALTANNGLLPVAAVPALCLGLFVACVVCHGELARTKPAPQYLTQFYLCLSAGGALGGLFVAVVAPGWFDHYWETPIALVGVGLLVAFACRKGNRFDRIAGVLLGILVTACVLMVGGWTLTLPPASADGAGMALEKASMLGIAALIVAVATWKRWSLAIAVTVVVCTGFYSIRYHRFLVQDTLHASRNFYGALRVKDYEGGDRFLMHGLILHGVQHRAEGRRREPTTYYGPSSGIGLALQALRPPGTPIDVAMVGLGTGTLAAWGKPGDRYRIYELNPAVVGIARRDFTFLADSRASTEVVLGDARLAMERELAEGSARPFDVIAVDAFSGDSIPIHLITREALKVFMRHLKPDGIVAFHVSNRYLDLSPVVGQLADDAHLTAVEIYDRTEAPGLQTSIWVLVTCNADFIGRDDVRRRRSPIAPVPGLELWTDQYNNLFRIIR